MRGCKMNAIYKEMYDEYHQRKKRLDDTWENYWVESRAIGKGMRVRRKNALEKRRVLRNAFFRIQKEISEYLSTFPISQNPEIPKKRDNESFSEWEERLIKEHQFVETTFSGSIGMGEKVHLLNCVVKFQENMLHFATVRSHCGSQRYNSQYRSRLYLMPGVAVTCKKCGGE